MVERCSPAVSEDRGHTSKVDGLESLAISIRDVGYKLMNLKIILLLIHCLMDMPTSQARLSYLVMAERYCTVRVMVSEDRWATLYSQWEVLARSSWKSLRKAANEGKQEWREAGMKGGRNDNPTAAQCLETVSSLRLQGSLELDPVRGNCRRKRRKRRLFTTQHEIDNAPLPKRRKK